MNLWRLAVKLHTKRPDALWIQWQNSLHYNLLPIRYYNLLWKKFWKGNQLWKTPSDSRNTVYNISQSIIISGHEVNFFFSETISLDQKFSNLCRNLWYAKMCVCVCMSQKKNPNLFIYISGNIYNVKCLM